MPESLAIFDFAEPSMVVGTRNDTVVPGQALYMMNDEFVIQQGEAMARRLIREADTSRDRFTRAFVLAFGRFATEDEVESCVTFFRQFVPEAEKTMSSDSAKFLALSSFCQGLMASAEFRFVN